WSPGMRLRAHIRLEHVSQSLPQYRYTCEAGELRTSTRKVHVSSQNQPASRDYPRLQQLPNQLSDFQGQFQGRASERSILRVSGLWVFSLGEEKHISHLGFFIFHFELI